MHERIATSARVVCISLKHDYDNLFVRQAGIEHILPALTLCHLQKKETGVRTNIRDPTILTSAFMHGERKHTELEDV